ncbi:MAG: site-2 protease family protein [Holosporaceae bacterium]|nr:MAG: site-2 protease family protein [Holosporaceae bacterium]
MWGWLIPFLLVLTVLVFIHELGHYLLARWNGVRVEVFSIGFGPALLSCMDRHGTVWKFSLIPLGGYVKMYGDANEASTPDAQAFLAMTDEERALTLRGNLLCKEFLYQLQGQLLIFFLPFYCFLLCICFKETFFITYCWCIARRGVAAKSGVEVGDEINQSMAIRSQLLLLCRALL